MGKPSKNDRSLQISDLKLTYRLPDRSRISVLDIPSFEVGPSASIGIMGPSGSGKTSLLYVLAGIEVPQQGTVRWGKVEVSRLSSVGRDRWRQKNVGFVFQDIHLQSPGQGPTREP